MTFSAEPALARLLAEPAVATVLTLLDGDGEEARVVGGAVRNALLGRGATDVDVATTARPDTVLARAAAAGLRTVPTGLAHGTVTVLVSGVPIEVTTLREDIETDGRHAVIRFGRDFGRDALRRDFTVNALSVGRNGVVHDNSGGLADLAAGRVRFLGDPATRIREDYLRILRFFRFSADYADDLDEDGLAAAIAGRDGLPRLSRERVRRELMKLLVARRAAPVVAAMAEAGLLGPLLRGVAQPARFARLVALDARDDAVLRLAALAVQVEEDAERLRDALKLSNADVTRLTQAARVARHGLPAPATLELRRLLFAAGRPASLDALRLAWADSRAAPDDPAWRDAVAACATIPEPRLPFTATDLLDRGMTPGPAIGQALKRLRTAWVDAGFPGDAGTLSRILAVEMP